MFEGLELITLFFTYSDFPNIFAEFASLFTKYVKLMLNQMSDSAKLESNIVYTERWPHFVYICKHAYEVSWYLPYILVNLHKFFLSFISSLISLPIPVQIFITLNDREKDLCYAQLLSPDAWWIT